MFRQISETFHINLSELEKLNAKRLDSPFMNEEDFIRLPLRWSNSQSVEEEESDEEEVAPPAKGNGPPSKPKEKTKASPGGAKKTVPAAPGKTP
jgi:hypothetical protein